jgi:hypothetical protein
MPPIEVRSPEKLASSGIPDQNLMDVVRYQ